MFILKSTHEEVVKNLKEEIQNLKELNKTALFMYEVANKEELKTIDQIKNGTVIVTMDDRKRFQVVEVSSDEFFLFRIYEDGTKSMSTWIGDYGITKEKLFDRLKNHYIRILES